MKTLNIKAKSLFVKAALLFSTLLLVSTLVTTDSHANMINKFKTGFYFEKYETPEEAKAELLKLHPIGSDVEGLVGTLEGAGAKVYRRYISHIENNKTKIEDMGVGAIFSHYEYRIIRSFFPRQWNISIDHDIEGKIISLKVRIYQGE